MATAQMNATVRTEVGTGAAHRVRMQNLVPGIMYGPNYPSTPITIDQKELHRIVKENGIHAIVQLITNQGSQYCMVKELQRDPVSGSVIHADFETIDMNQKVKTNIPILMVGHEIAEKYGVLQRQLGEITVEGMPNQIPKYVQANVAQLNLGESIRVADLEIAEEISILSDLEGIIATLTAVRNDPADTDEVKVIGEVNEIKEDPAVKKAKETREE